MIIFHMSHSLMITKQKSSVIVIIWPKVPGPEVITLFSFYYSRSRISNLTFKMIYLVKFELWNVLSRFCQHSKLWIVQIFLSLDQTITKFFHRFMTKVLDVLNHLEIDARFPSKSIQLGISKRAMWFGCICHVQWELWSCCCCW